MKHTEPAAQDGNSKSLDEERMDKGLRVAFGEDTPGVDRYRSVFEHLCESTEQLSRFNLVDLDEEPSPLHRPRAESDALPAQIGRYRIAGEVARGGVGAIYKARDEELGREVALKVLLRDHRSHPEMLQRFLEEAQIGAQLQHPGLVPVHELGLFGDKRPYFAMKLVKGKTLGRLLAERKEPSEERLRFLGIFEQICQPLAYSHARGVIHRDLKPSNVMVGAFGEVQVMDWGLAKVLARGGLADDHRKSACRTEVSVIETVRSGGSSGGSLAGSVFGTPAYMAPEQARGEVEHLDERADVFGLGAILCEILTGYPPYVAETTEEVHRMAKRGYLDDAMARLKRSGGDREVVELARRCLAFEPRDRPQDAQTVAREVRAYIDSLEERAKQVELRAARTRFRATAATLLILAVGAASASYLWFDRERREVLAESTVRLEKAVSEARVRMAEAEASAGSAPKWAAAREAVEAAGRLVTLGAMPGSEEELANLRRRVESEMEAHKLVAALEKIRDAALYGNDSYVRYDAAYGQAFAEFLGADLFSLSPLRVVERLRQTTRSAEIAQALDDWALLRRELRRPHETQRDISCAIDSNPSRARIWQLIEGAGVESVERFVDGPEGRQVSASLLCVLADSLSLAGHLSAAERLLRRALESDSGSFRANFQLGRLLALSQGGRAGEGLPHLFAARTLRPRDRCTNFRLAEGFAAAGLWDQALGQCAVTLDLGFADDWGTRDILGILEKDGAAFAPAVLDRFLQATERIRARDPNVDPRIWRVVGAARCIRAVGTDASDMLAMAEADVAREGRSDPFVLGMLARVQSATGDRRAAVRTLEEAMALPGAGPESLRHLRLLRRELLPEIVSYGSVDAALDEPEALIVQGDEWRYFRGTELPSAGLEWAQADYDDGSWERGPSGFGYGDGDDRTVLADMQGNYSSLYVRRAFVIEDPGRFRRFLLNVVADDGFVAYLNGQLVGAARMNPADRSLSATATEAPEPIAPVAIDLTGKLCAGSNLLAIRATNKSLESTDFSLIPELLGEPVVTSLVETLRSGLESRGQLALAAYLDGCWLERQGKAALAAKKLQEVVRMDRRSALPFQRLWATLRAAHGPQAARAAFQKELEDGLPDGLIHAAFEPPSELSADEREEGIELAADGAPWHPDPRIRIGHTRWQIRSVAADYDAPALDVTTDRLTRLLVPRDRLRPHTTFVARASGYSETVGDVVWSDEHRFTTSDYPFEVIPIDLSSHFDSDLVANPGDAENDAIDGETGYFVVDGYDGGTSGNAQVQGFPGDGIVGLHRLAGYDGPNAICLRPGRKEPVRVEVPPRRYSVLRFLASAGHNDALRPVELIYADGSSERRVIHFHDWFDDPGPMSESEHGPLTPDTVPLLNGMDRLHNAFFEDANDPALFETALAVDPRKNLVAFVLAGWELAPDQSSTRAGELDPNQTATRVGIFAVTGVWTGSDAGGR